MNNTALPGPQSGHPRQLKISLSDLDDAFNNAGQEASYYLDRDTGRVILLTQDTLYEFGQLSEGLGEVDTPNWAAAFEAALREGDVPDWEVDMVRDAGLIEADTTGCYLEVPGNDSRAGYRDMEAFIDTVADPLAERLARAIGGRRPFRAFKDELLDNPLERDHWFAFSAERQRQRVLEWLEAEGIEPE